MTTNLARKQPAEAIPDWLPCYHCNEALSVHIDSKCPFEASSFHPSDSQLIFEALYEMRRMQAARSPQARARLALLGDSQKRDYRLALEIVLDRWLKEQGID